LPASILATGFSEEMRRRNFMSTWNLVAKVPMFASMHAGQIAEIASLLRPQRVSKGDIVVREGDVGDSMYFIVGGQVEARTTHGNFILRAGDFFGEIAMVERNPRTATVVATTRSQLLELQVLDFQRFVGRYPELLDVIRETAKNRLQK
jgi:voltage-gated potassium channel